MRAIRPTPDPVPTFTTGSYVKVRPGKGAALRRRRLSRGLTQAQLGYLCDEASQATISMLESEKLPSFTPELAVLVCRYLDIELEDYFDVRSGSSASGVSNDQSVVRRRPGRGGRRNGRRLSTTKDEAA